MKKSKIMLSIILVGVFLFAMTISVFAQGSDVINHDNGCLEEYTDENVITPNNMWNCTNCSFLCNSVCTGNLVLNDAGEHSYGVLGLGGKCYAEYYTGSSVIMCTLCNDIKASFSGHYCKENHASCGKGYVDVCQMEISMDELR